MPKLPTRCPRRFSRLGLAALFVVAGANHFVSTGFYVDIMPAYLPLHLELVYLSGLLEMLGGAAVLVPQARSRAGWLLIALLVVVLPANLNMALNSDQFPGLSAFALYARLPVQGLLIAWAYWATRPETGVSGSAPAADRHQL